MHRYSILDIVNKIHTYINVKQGKIVLIFSLNPL
jgi:hypothetical protein